MTDPAALSSALIGEIFVERGHITSDQLEEALVAQSQTGELLGEILVSRYNVPRVELAGVLAEQWAIMERGGEPSDPVASPPSPAVANGPVESVTSAPEEDSERRPIGEIFVEHGMVSQSQLDSALSAQSESGQRLGEVLVAQGAITRLELASALAEQWSTLQKIRPPEPKSTEAWQESAVRAAAVEPGAEPSPIAPPTADVEHLRDAVQALEERLRTVSASSGPAPPDEQLRETTAALAARIDGLESRIDGVAAPELGELQATVGELRTSLAELQARLEAPDPGVAELERRLESRIDGVAGPELGELQATVGELRTSLAELQARLEAPDPGVAELERRLETAVDGLLARIETLSVQPHEAAPIDDAALDSMRDTLAGLQEQTSGLAAIDEVDAVRVVLGAVSEQVKELAARGDGVTHEELERRIGVAVDDLRERLDAAEPRHDDALATELRGALAGLESRLDQVQAATPSADFGQGVAEVGLRIDELAGRIDEVLAGSGEAVQSALQPFEQRIAELSQQLGSLPSSDRVAELDARLTEVTEQEAKARAELVARLDEERAGPTNWAHSDEVAALATRIGELGSRLEATPPPERIEAIERELDAVREVTHARPVVPGAEAIEEIQTALAELTARLREVASRPTGVSQDHLERRITEVAERLAETPSTAPSDEVTAELASVRLSLVALEERVAQAVAAETVAGLDATLTGVGARVDELAASVAAIGPRGQEELTKDQIEGLLATERTARESLSARLDELVVAGKTDEEARAALGDVQRQLSEYAGLRHQVEALANVEDQTGALEELRSELAELPQLRTRVEELAQLGQATDDLSDMREQLASLAQLGDQVAELATRPDYAADLDGLRKRVGQLAERGDNTEALTALEKSLVERHENEAAARGTLEAQLADVRTGLHAVDELREQVQVLSAASNELARHSDLEELRERLAELGGRLDGLASTEWVASVERAAGDVSLAVGERLDGIEQRMLGLDRTAEIEQVHTVVGDLLARIGGLDSGLAALRGSVDATISSALGSALEHSVSHDALSQLAAELHGRIAELDAANAPTRAALDELGMRLGAAEQQAWGLPEQLDDRFAVFYQELSGRIEGLGLGYDAALVAMSGRLDELVGTAGTDAERVAGLEAAAASANVRLEGLEARQAKDGTIVDQIAALTARLDAELAVAEERGAATERAIRKGLAGLGERLTANEETYLESGAALRRSIERLGAAVVEADTRLAELPLDPPEYGYVAFVPTPDGYRLRPLDGAAPNIGDVLELEGAAGPLRVTRIARSPLPLDRRACAYLERT